MEALPSFYMELGPGTMDEIETDLFLGGQAAARNAELLQKNNITHVLSIDIRPYPATLAAKNNLTTKYVQLMDLPSADLLSHLDDSYNFIAKAQQNGSVLVHCYFGISRSASFVIGYLMRKYQMSYDDAYEVVRCKRGIVLPNEGFVAQLRIYRLMGYRLDKDSIHLKMHRLTVAADSVKRLRVLSKDFLKLIRPDPSNEKQSSKVNLCRCRKCKRLLATEANILPHKDKDKICDKMFFMEPITWMNVTKSDRGRLFCPKCSLDVGNFNWVVGNICPCGFRTTPAFCINASKVEFVAIAGDVWRRQKGAQIAARDSNFDH
ncbi:unnamed protein product [Phyllotreta striolata]|uniref:Protein-tyrosine-phosphatase n=1 Tax=Phyllotreta striolata TaxID=444603 RepID=A0A9N9TAJ9_PHYSR|nr:unnamed protein product [Phyllotreta striolata]